MGRPLDVRAGGRAVTAGFLTVLTLLAVARAAPAIEPWPSVRPSTSGAEERILDVLDRPTTVRFFDTPLEEVLVTLERRHDIEMELDQKSIDRVSVGTDTPITRNLSGISLRSVLRLILGNLGLSYVVRDEVLLITTITAAERQPEVRMYDVAELLGDEDSANPIARLLEHAFGDQPAPRAARAMSGRGSARRLATSRRSPERMRAADGPRPGPRRFYAYQHVLVVHDTESGHQEVARYLSALAESLEGRMHDEDEEEEENEETEEEEGDENEDEEADRSPFQ